jgi:hypothetical protein
LERFLAPNAPLMAAVYEAEYRRRDAAPVAGEMAVSLLDIARLAYTASSPDDLFDRLVSTRVSDVARRVPSRWGRISLGEFVAMVEEGGGAAYHEGYLATYEDLVELLGPLQLPVPAANLALRASRIGGDASLSRALLQLLLDGGTPVLVGDCVVTLRSALCGFAGQCVEREMSGVPFDAYSYSVPAPELDASATLSEALRLLNMYGVVVVDGGVLTPRALGSIVKRSSRPGRMRLSEYL